MSTIDKVLIALNVIGAIAVFDYCACYVARMFNLI